jgi:hypothetical protein
MGIRDRFYYTLFWRFWRALRQVFVSCAWRPIRQRLESFGERACRYPDEHASGGNGKSDVYLSVKISCRSPADPAKAQRTLRSRQGSEEE